MLRKGRKSDTFRPANSRKRKFKGNQFITEKEYAEQEPSGQRSASKKN